MAPGADQTIERKEFTARLRPDLLDAMEEIAAEEDVSRNTVLQWAVDAYTRRKALVGSGIMDQEPGWVCMNAHGLNGAHAYIRLLPDDAEEVIEALTGAVERARAARDPFSSGVPRGLAGDDATEPAVVLDNTVSFDAVEPDEYDPDLTKQLPEE